MSLFFFFSSRRRHTRSKRDWSSDVCSSDLKAYKTMSCPKIAEFCTIKEETVEKSFRGESVSLDSAQQIAKALGQERSEERRVGKECRARWAAEAERREDDERGGGVGERREE